MKYTRVLTTFTHEELEQIEQYAASRGIKKATAVKELAIRGLELTTKTNTEFNFYTITDLFKLMDQEQVQQQYFLQQQAKITDFINNNKYLEALKVLNELKNHTDNQIVLAQLGKAIKQISKYETIFNMRNYLNNK